MKLLFDENLSAKLVRLLADVYPGSEHVRTPGLLNALDEQVFVHAGSNGFVLVSQDRDFRDLSALRGVPPKVVWLRVRNARTVAIADLAATGPRAPSLRRVPHQGAVGRGAL